VRLDAALAAFIVALAVCGCRTTTPPPIRVEVPVVVPPEPLPLPEPPPWESRTSCDATWQTCLEALGHDLAACWQDDRELRAIIGAHNTAVEALKPQ
jgi:hypothetical protein